VATFRSRLLSLGELRDAALFIATVIYVLGYSAWAIYSANRGLGVLPPLEGQYFLAGIVPLVLLLTGTWVFRAITPAPSNSHRKRALSWGKWLILLGGIVGMVAAVMAPLWIAVVATLVTFFGLALTIRSGETREMLWPFRFLVALSLIGSANLYAVIMFPLIPRELDGPSPSCVQVDVVRSSVASATAEQLGLAAVPSPDLAVRSAPLWLYFDGGGLLVVSRAGDPARQVIRMRGSDVGAVISSSGCPARFDPLAAF
jgi:hypothetical protein